MSREREYLRLVKKYRKLIQELYDVMDESRKVFSSDYTPDWMGYDFEGFAHYVDADELEEEYLPVLRKAVKHAKDYIKWVKARPTEYGYTFG